MSASRKRRTMRKARRTALRSPADRSVGDRQLSQKVALLLRRLDDVVAASALLLGFGVKPIAC
jgi:hypothetical protein